ncbi:MAG: helix-turn-helix transcriptional regulator [Clostridia bacterium]|nr:helix-turn-helix transcriptional regulator [Clostridia bacterium]
MDIEFVAQRITELRMKKNVSEYKMSRDLGHGRSYIQNIASGHSNPSMVEFLYICEYLGVTPSAFFDEENEEPILIQRALDGLKKLNEKDLTTLIQLIERLNEDKG